MLRPKTDSGLKRNATVIRTRLQGEVLGMFRPGWNQHIRFNGFVCAAGLLGLAALAAGCGKTSAGDPAAGGAMQAMPVQVLIAKSQKIPDATEYLSILKSRHSATINPQVEGQITRIFVKSGDRVAAGTPLLQIDPLKQQATVSSQDATRLAQEANLRYAKVQLDREKKLFEAGVVAKQELDNAQTNYDAALSAVEVAGTAGGDAAGGVALLRGGGAVEWNCRGCSGACWRSRGGDYVADYCR